MNEFIRFVEWAGGAKEAAALLSCSTVLVYKLMKGERAVTHRTARKIIEVGGKRFSLTRLIMAEAA